MKTLLFLLLSWPLGLWAQTEMLKPIESDLVPRYGGRYGTEVRTQYVYDGLDVRHPKDLRKYIMASADGDAIREFNAYMVSRRAGSWLIAAGVLTSGIGLGVALTNDRSGEASLGTYSSVATPMPNGTVCGGYCNAVPDRTNRTAVRAGITTMASGLLMVALGGWMLRPGQHMRRSVQYYNRALKQQGILWQLTPHSSVTNSGVGLVGRF